MKPTNNNDTRIIAAGVMWTPDPDKWTRVDDFRKLINAKYELKLENYHALYDWSCVHYPDFWREFWSYSKIVHSKTYEQVVDERKNISEIPEWFKGARLNFAENLLRFKGDKIALYEAGEGKSTVRTRTFDELRSRASKYARAMRALGIRSGDRVVSYAPNCIENVEAMLGAASLGAVWSATSPDFGVTGVLERFSQIQPKLIFSVAAVHYNGRNHDHLDRLRQVASGLPELLKVVIIPFVDGDRRTADISDVQNAVWLDEFLELEGEEVLQDGGQVLDPEYVQLPFNHPLYIMYSSGTTGVPKCLVHSAGGTLIQHLKEHMFGNLTEKDVIMFYTTTGWMMWNWLISALALGASVVLYDGSPFASRGNVLWDLVDSLKITILGTGAKCLAVMEEKGLTPIRTHNLGSLHTILSTGSPLKPQSYDYVYSWVKNDLMLSSISGGTDIIGCFMGPNPTLPVHRGEVQSCHLAMAMECWIEQDEPVLGQSGELVCTKPHPSMPIYFWNDPEGVKYRKAYFEEFKGVWCHGDFCLINPVTRGLVMLGRSDGTLNPNGVRFGSAEIYNIVESFEEIEDSLCVGQMNEAGSEERVLLFVKMTTGQPFDQRLVERIKAEVRAQLSPRHIPAHILETTDIPYTISGKKVEVAVRNVLEGKKVKHTNALINPHSLELYKNIPQLKGF